MGTIAKKPPDIWDPDYAMPLNRPRSEWGMQYISPSFKREASMSSVFDKPSVKKDSFQGLNYQVWDNAKFTTVFSWDSKIDITGMGYYYSHHRKDNSDVDSTMHAPAVGSTWFMRPIRN